MKKHLLSAVWLALLAISLAFFAHYGRWKNQLVGGGDDWGYYSYLPAFFIHDDLDSLHRTLALRHELRPGSYPFVDGQPQIEEAKPVLRLRSGTVENTGRRVFKYTSGLAIAQAPFFGAAHLFCRLTGRFPANGYSEPYVFAVFFASIFYVFAGLILLKKVLRRHFSTKITALVLAILLLATNLHYFTIYNPGMAHAFLFSLFCLLIFSTVRFFESPNWRFAALIGLSIGWIALIRPTEIIAVFIPVFWGIQSRAGLVERLVFFKNRWKWLVLAALAGFVICLPQLTYWKMQTGRWLFYSYTEEGFHFLHPEIRRGMFGYMNGWLAYTPVMWLALVGIFMSWRQNRGWRLAVVAFLPIHIWLTYSWWNWQYINGFGSRPMVETYALLSLPLAVFIQKMNENGWKRLVLVGFVGFFCWLNLFNTWQLSKGILWTEAGNMAAYFTVFGKTKMDERGLIALESSEWQPDSSDLIFEKQLFETGFEDSTIAHSTTENVFAGKRAFRLGEATEFSPGFQKKASELPDVQPGNYLEATMMANMPRTDGDIYRMNSLVIEFSRGGKIYRGRSVRIDSKIGNPTFNIWGGEAGKWSVVRFKMKVPSGFAGDDVLKVYAWRSGRLPVFMDELRVSLWRKK